MTGSVHYRGWLFDMRRFASLGAVSIVLLSAVSTNFVSAEPVCAPNTICLAESPHKSQTSPVLQTDAGGLHVSSGGARDRVGLGLSIRSAVSAAMTIRPELYLRESGVFGLMNPDHDDDYAYRLPYGDDVSFPVMQGYGTKFSHRGSEYFTVDFRMAEGTLVHAAREGIVVRAEGFHDRSCWVEGCGRHANFVIILHTDGTTGEYFHLQRDSALVSVGDYVQRGQAIARSGNTGYTTVAHLHFGVYRVETNGRSQSVAARFMTRDGAIGKPRIGARYQNAALE